LGIVNRFAVKRRWTRKEIKLLGKHPDQELAKRMGRMINAVAGKRQSLNIPMLFSQRRVWTKKDSALLGKNSDVVVAKKIGRSVEAVRSQRFIRGTPVFSAKKLSR